MQDLLIALGNIFEPSSLLVLLIGTLAGMVIGSLPGLSSTMGVALVIPITFSMTPENSLILLGAVYVSSVYGGSITAILLRTPGTDASIATALDGYPLAQQGRGAEAVGMATIASLIGGIFSTVLLIAVAPPLSRFALSFGPIDYAVLAIFGMVTIIGVVSSNPVKGTVSAAAGLLLATIGMDNFTATQRFTFGESALFDGVPLLPALIGLFSISQAIALTVPRRASILSETADINHGRPYPSLGLIRQCMRTIMKSSVIGSAIGVLPGAGTSIAAFISYNEARRSSKNPENYGKGEMEGVAASEAANNAVTGGTLVPTLTLGIPGNAVTAVFVGGLTIHGMAPGPRLFTDFADVTYTLILSLFLANLLFAIIGLSVGRYLVFVTKIPGSVLGPLVLAFSFIGTYALRNNLFDVGLALAFGIVGYFMERRNYPAAPLVIALILGPIFEVNFRRAMEISSWNWAVFFDRPLTIFLIFLVVAAVVLPIWQRRKARRAARFDRDRHSEPK
ncbi:tripartite tricarboxylate transporter permease [Citreimonas salinaria]|uniref:Putative tricarboxylic transport membrane protein n=1 Tax=Citreimonas salinaria TaxID=321339 RepID=A0A1H3M1I7_9RHOB|nr:tripartite tricarboxylate transporter permease [Citreimonas salinaria]SDY70144.1 putative tricarboxylic transport membrane protein [Citreimonas salinaria]